MGCVYIVVNQVNGKVYIGKSEVSMESRRRVHKCEAKNGSEKYFHRAIRKHGFSNFVWRELYRSDDPEDLSRFEVEAIAEHKSKTPNGYNMTDGGEGMRGWSPDEAWKKRQSQITSGTMTPEHRARLSKIHKNLPAATRKRMIEAVRKGTVGRKPSKEELRKRSEALSGHEVTPETRDKIRKSLIGHKISEETRQKIRRTLLRYYAEHPEAKKNYRRHAKLTDDQVVEIRRRLDLGESQSSIASSYGVSPNIISRIHRRVTYSHVP